MEASARLVTDVGLQSALEELSSLSLPLAAISSRDTPVQAILQSSPSGLSAAESDGQRDSMRIVPLSTAGSSSSPQLSEESHSETVGQQPTEGATIEALKPMTVSEMRGSEISHVPLAEKQHGQPPSDSSLKNSALITAENDRRDDLASALQELVDQHGLKDSASRSPATGMASHCPKRTGWQIGSALTVVAAFGAGVYVGQTFVAVAREKSTVAVSSPVRAGDGRVIAAAETIPVNAVTGRVMYADEGGAMKPDSNALVLLVPAENKAGLKLDARPLRELHVSDAKLAVEAAIHILKGSVTRAADDGTFRLEQRYTGPGKLVIISRHASRPENEPVEMTAANTLASWFESPSQLTGRLQVQEKSITAVEPENARLVEVTFGKP